MAVPENLTVPLKLDAFVLNEEVCNGDLTESKIAPITQPNYTFLQLKDGLIQHDILDHVDLHNATPASSNSRLYDLGQGTLRENRVGVYLHWTLPRFYRTGSAATPSGKKDHVEECKTKGISTSENTEGGYAAPQFRPLPNRWLVVRTLEPDAETTEPKGTPIQPVEAWVIESDRLRSLEDNDLDDADLQVDTSPYITTNKESVGNINLDEQAETFIGYKARAASWKRDEEKSPEEKLKRVDLTAISSSNQLFLDYQPHCSNVFSTVDTFSYGENGESLKKAVANYYVIGWHADAVEGPLGDLREDSTTTRQARLDALAMTLSGKSKDWSKDIEHWLQSKEQAKVLCHGAMYNVVWNDSRLPENVPSNKAAHTLLDSMPVTVGTTPMDSLLSYIDTHTHNNDETDDVKKLEADIHLIDRLLRAQDDGVEAQRIAMDEVQNWNFARESGGVHWHLQNQEGEPPKKPTTDQSLGLKNLNQAQRVRDSTAREILQLRWQMFSYWWRYVSAVDRHKIPNDTEQLKKKVDALQNIISDQDDLITALLNEKEIFPTPPQKGVLAEFNQPRDPTLLVAGIQAGWPDDFLDKLRVRLDSQLVPLREEANLDGYGIEKLPGALQSTARALIREFIALRKGAKELPSHAFMPLYHDHGKHGKLEDPQRDQWGETQPWAPLFLEWQAEYFHIPWDNWTLMGNRTDQLDTKWRLGVNPDVDLQKLDIHDSRPLSGRILLLPQPNFSLQATIDQLFTSVDPETLNKYLDEEQREEVKTMTYKLPFLSAPLDGFTDHLLTLVHGTHIKPNVRYPAGAGYEKEGLHPIKDAQVDYFDETHLKIIDIHSELTPYGSVLVHSASDDDETSKRAHPFKPATHGQFRFSKLNIIDKFGQAICAIDPRYGHEDEQSVLPHLSAYFEPQLFNDKANLVRQPRDGCEGHCEFAQVPPGINQPSRLNSTFVTREIHYDPNRPNDYSYWRPVTEWENPIWGWIVVNYVDYGIQIFLPDGTFYREVRLASPDAPQHNSTSPKWLPFAPPTNHESTEQLDHFIALLNKPDQKYLHSFLSMTNEFLARASSAPSAYAGFLNSLVGRPLALVNAGWSLELATNEKANQADIDNHTEPDQPIKLIGGRNDRFYEFPMKLGDEDRANDGLVGYFSVSDTPTAGNELDLDQIYTYYSKGNGSDGAILQQISTDNLPKLSSFWLDPSGFVGDGASPIDTANSYAQVWNKKLKVFGTIIDPFLPITAYSSILPINNLRLPTWTWQQAMQKMTAFFHLGPIVVTDDVEKYRKEKSLGADYRLDHEELYPTLKDPAVGMPSLPTGNWAWLQPFVEDSADAETTYKPLGLGRVDGRPKFQQGPYTAIEGYLQLREPIVRDGKEG